MASQMTYHGSQMNMPRTLICKLTNSQTAFSVSLLSNNPAFAHFLGILFFKKKLSVWLSDIRDSKLLYSSKNYFPLSLGKLHPHYCYTLQQRLITPKMQWKSCWAFYTSYTNSKEAVAVSIINYKTSEPMIFHLTSLSSFAC